MIKWSQKSRAMTGQSAVFVSSGSVAGTPCTLERLNVREVGHSPSGLSRSPTEFWGASRLQESRSTCSWFVSYWLVPQEGWLPGRMRTRYYIQPQREQACTVCYLQYVPSGHRISTISGMLSTSRVVETLYWWNSRTTTSTVPSELS